MSVAVASARYAERKPNGLGRFFTWLWFGSIAALIVWGWSIREEDYIHAESGLGYWLGISGGSMMLLLLSYSLRKRWAPLRKFLSVKFWFRLHMTLGVLGPTAIIFHSNFHIASLNSTVAFVCMLLVASSGIIGRYMYQRIHFGLYGEKVKLQQVLKDFHALRDIILDLAADREQKNMASHLFASIEELINEQRQNLGYFASYRSRNKVRAVTKEMAALVVNLLKGHDKSGPRRAELASAHADLKEKTLVMLAALNKLPGLQFWERLFSLWHVIHIPIFFMMIVTAIVHVVVVHMY